MALGERVILLTGFEPFGGEITNPSAQVVEALHGSIVADCRVVGRVLPVAFAAGVDMALAAVRELDPVLVLGLGQAKGRAGLSLERVALNIIDAPIPDNAGSQPQDLPVVPGGPLALPSGLPVRRILTSWAQQGIAGQVSSSAGTYVCNAVFYALCHAVGENAPVGFVHVPLLPEQTKEDSMPTMSLDEIIAGVRSVLATSSAPVG